MNADVEFEESTQTVSDYLKVFKRRRKQMVIPVGVIIFISLLVAIFWPPTYESTATILIEEQQIPADLVPSTVTSFAAQQIEVIKARIMTMKNIMQMVEKYNLLSEDDLRRTARSVVVGDFVENVGMDVLSAGIIDPLTGRPAEATIAFTLSFSHEAPEKAQKVANELVSLYLNENLRDRTEKSTTTSLFLQEEADSLAIELEELEQRLADFKSKNEGSLPELYQYNLQVLDRTERDKLEASLRLKELEKRKLEIESQMVQISPYAAILLPTGEPVLSDYDRLKALRSEYRQKIAVYNSEHPDIVRLKREIDVLEAELGSGLSEEDYREQLKLETNQLAEINQKYTAGHPKVLAQQRVLDQLLKERAAVGKIDVSRKEDADNPAYVLLDTQLQSTIVEMQILKENMEELKKKLLKYEGNILKAPMVEKQYIAMYRDYGNTTDKYQEIKAKLMAAELAQNLEQGRKGQRFTLIDPPALPEEPVSPNRPAIIFLGVVFALGIGLGVVVVAEAISPAVTGERALSNIVGATPLVSIPYILLETEEKNIDYRKYYILGGVASVFLIGLFCVHYFITPLDVIWFRFSRNILGIG